MTRSACPGRQQSFESRRDGPGLWFERNGRVLVVMPGVPYEMKAIMEGSVLPRLGDLHGEGHHPAHAQDDRDSGKHACAASRRPGRTPGDVEARVPPVAPRRAAPDYRRGIGPGAGRSDRGARGGADTRPRGRVRVRTGDQEIEQVVGALLAERGQTLGVAESCTGGQIAGRITDVAGSSAYFERGSSRTATGRRWICSACARRSCFAPARSARTSPRRWRRVFAPGRGRPMGYRRPALQGPQGELPRSRSGSSGSGSPMPTGPSRRNSRLRGRGRSSRSARRRPHWSS